MSYRSNAAEAWYSDPRSTSEQADIPLDLLPPESLTQPLWRSLVGNLRDTFAPTKLPPLVLTSRPASVGLALGERLRLPWFRTVFTNIGDVLSPETLPPLELESRPVDVGELITDQLSHFWWGSLLRNLADRVAPETQASLNLTAKPILDIIPKSWILLPMWSEVVDTPKVFYPDKPKSPDAVRPINLHPVGCRRKSWNLWSKNLPPPIAARHPPLAYPSANLDRTGGRASSIHGLGAFGSCFTKTS